MKNVFMFFYFFLLTHTYNIFPQWNNLFGFTLGGTRDAYSIMIPSDENICVFGMKFTQTGPSYGTIRMFSRSGNILWESFDDTPETSIYPGKVAQKFENYIVSSENRFSGESRIFLINKINGEKQFIKTFSCPVSPVIFGDAILLVSSEYNSRISAIDTLGNVLWENQTGLIVQTSGGSPTIRVSGSKMWIFANFFDPSVPFPFGKNSYVALFDISTKSVVWIQGRHGERQFGDIDSSGNSYIGTCELYPEPQAPDSLILRFRITKYDKNGVLLKDTAWIPRETPITNLSNFPNTVRVLEEKDLLVFGGVIQKGDTHSYEQTAYLKIFTASTLRPIKEYRWNYGSAVISSVIDVACSDSSLFVLNSAVDQTIMGQILWKDIANIVGIEDEFNLPESFTLLQNHPNPFNPTTSIRYSVLNTQYVNLTVYNVLGQEIQTLVNEEKYPGTYTVTLDASGLSSGIYFYRLTAGQYTETKKMILQK